MKLFYAALPPLIILGCTEIQETEVADQQGTLLSALRLLQQHFAIERGNK